jgi:hypothetical protein
MLPQLTHDVMCWLHSEAETMTQEANDGYGRALRALLEAAPEHYDAILELEEAANWRCAQMTEAGYFIGKAQAHNLPVALLRCKN